MTGLINSGDGGPEAPDRTLAPELTPDSATAVLDDSLRFIAWSREAEELFGHLPSEVLGRSADDILADAATGAGVCSAGGARAQELGIRSVRRRDGSPLSVALTLKPLSYGATGSAWLVVATDAKGLHRRSVDRAVLAGLQHDSLIHLVVYDNHARVRSINRAIEKQFGVTPEEVVGRFTSEIVPQGVVLKQEGGQPTEVEEIVEHVVRTGEPLVDVRYLSSTPLDPHREHVWTCSYFRLQDESGRTIGACEVGIDMTDRYVARQRLALLSRASGSIGGTLDIRRTAEDLTQLAVPEFADAARVDLVEPVLRGEDSARWTENAHTPPELCRVAEDAGDVAAGGTVLPDGEIMRLRCLTDAVPFTDPAAGVLVVPLRARGTVLGVASFLRSGPRPRFDAEEIALAGELASRTAVCVDNARRYTRERATALTLQRDLLPRALPRPPGVEVAHRYLPALGPRGVGGDWYDVIPLSGARVGLAVGDVAGHGMDAAATMGRLRTTVAALAALDLGPDELLARLDDLVARTGAPGDAHTPDVEDRALGVTCLYAIYDPVSRRCVMARAGHLPPVLVSADGQAELVDVPAGPPLGLGGLPFESAEVQLGEGDMLALFTDGLVENRQQDIDDRLRSLCNTLARSGDRALEETCDDVMDKLLPQPPQDDAALLLVRIHGLAEELVATWDVPVGPGEVARARRRVRDRLADWGVDESASFVVELVVSELVTNAIKYGGAPVGLRLIRESGLIVEVSDGGHTSPHLRRATTEDEGGRGLFLVAQLTRNWGTRYTSTGKIIWTEVSPAPTGLPDALAMKTFSF